MATAEVLSHNRVEPGSSAIATGKWPVPSKSTDIDADAIATKATEEFNEALQSKDYDTIGALFATDGYWRDHLGTTWDLRTLKGSDNIVDFLKKGSRLEEITIDRSSDYRKPNLTAFNGGDVKGVQFFITFKTTIGTGQGIIRMADYDGQWKIWNLFLSLKELIGHEEPLNTRRAAGVNHGYDPGRKIWLERRKEQMNYENHEPTVLVIGAGQGGLTVAARLKMQNVDTLIVDMNDAVGDNWRKRYSALVLHDPIWYDHLPYIPFPAHWPIFTPKDKLAEFFDSYAKLMELNVWMKSKIESSTWDEKERRWTVNITRTTPDGTVEKRTLHPKHIIQATGHSGKKNFPTTKGMDSFKGDLLCHSSEFTGAKKDSKGKKAVVVGACNSSHDICQDYYENGYDVTMVQRSSTCVVSSQAITDIGLAGLYDETGPPTEDADLFLWSLPSEILKALQSIVTAAQMEHDKKTIEGLEKAGFKVDRGPDDTGIFMKYFQRGGGYYIDVGASQLIVDGKIKIKQGQEIQEVTPHGLKFGDGSEIEADELVFATGYQNMRSEARTIFGDELADRINDVWGFTPEGEIRTMWGKSGHPGFWFMGGNLALCRYYSRILALQIKALEEGIAEY